MLAPLRLRAALVPFVLTLALLGLTAPAAQAAETVTWSGAESGLMSDPDNWGGVAPAAGDHLVIPASSGATTLVNDLAAGPFGSLTIAGPGYDLSGNAMTLTDGLSTTYTSGTSTINLKLTLSNGSVDIEAGGTLAQKGAIAGTGGLKFGGGGTLKLDSASNPASGSTTVGPGVLEVNGTIPGSVVLAGGTLAGSGRLNGQGITATAPSTVSPGGANSPGTLGYGSHVGLTLPNSSTFHVDIDGSTVGTGYDQLQLTNGSALFNPNGATLDVDLGYLPAVNTSFQIVSQTFGSPITGRFNGISQFGSFTSGPVTFSVGYFNSGVILTVTAVNIPTATWDGGGSTSNWSDANNWSGDTAPAAGHKLVFPSGVTKRATVNDFANGTEFGSVTIGEAGYTLAGSEFGTSGGLRTTYGSGVSTISSPMRAPGPVSVQSGGTLSIAGQVSGTNGLTKDGAGQLQLTAANSYSGITSVTAGTLAIANSSSLGSSTTGNGTVVSAGATLEIRGTINTSEPIRVIGTGDGGVGALYNGAGNNVVQSVTLTGDTSIGSASDTFLLIPSRLDESGGPARLTKIGTGVLDVLATSSHTGGTTVAAGTVATEGTVGSISVSSGATLSGAGGNVGDVTSAGGTVTAGFSTSPFTSDARSLTLDPASTFLAQLNGTASGNGSSGHSRLSVAQGVTLDGAKLDLTVNGGYRPTAGDALTILTTIYGVTGTFDGLPEGGYVSAGSWPFRITYQGGDGNDVVLTSMKSSSTTLTASPSPSSTGEEIALEASVTPSGSTGTVTFTDGSTTLGTVEISEGKAVLRTDTLTLGSHTIRATYNGSATTAPSTSAALTHGVVDSPPDTTITDGPANDSSDNPPSATFTFGSPDSDAVSYECSLDGATFSACASPKTFDDLSGGSHTFEVRAIDAGDNVDPTPAARTWDVTGVLAVTGDVEVEGTAKVGQTLTAVSTVATTPTSSAAGRWFRGQTPIADATGTTYVLTNDDVSSQITYRETRTRTSYAATDITSDPTAEVTGGIITLGAPTISGDPVVGQVLSAAAGSVSPASAEITLSWNVDGVPTGTTGTTYTVRPGDAGKAVTVTAEATKTDYDPATKTSEPTGDVAKAEFSTGPTASVSGVFKVGETLTAGEGTPVPTPDSYAYQWFAGGQEIAGATSRTFTVTTSQKGLSISVRVTAVRAGHVDAADTSEASALVVTNTAPELSLSSTTKKLRLGKAVRLSWTSSDATSLTASGAWSGTKNGTGNETVKPARTGTQTYQLTATNGNGTTTAQVAVSVALPPLKLSVKAPKSVKAGRKITVSTKALAPREAYTVRVGGVKIATGRATTTGKVKRSVRVPSSTKAGNRLVRVTGSLSDRTGTRRIKVTTKSAPKVQLRHASVRASDDQRVTVRGLHRSEKVKVTYRGKRISPTSAKANAKGVYTLTFNVGPSWGRKTVTVRAAESGRAVSKQFRVVNRCPQGGYYCR